MKNLSTAQSRLSRAMFFAAAFLLAALFPAASRAMLVSLTLTYSSTPLPTPVNPTDPPSDQNLYTDFHLHEGSIVQVIAYNTDSGGNPGTTGETGFEQYSTISQDDPAYQSGVDAGVFFPDTVKDPNHYIVYTGHITQLDNGQYGIVTDFTMDDSFNALYVRVFEATDFPQGQVTLSHWGIDGLTTGINPTIGHYSYNVSDVGADKLNYFEVIPEPASLSLFAVGTLALAAFRRKRNPHGKGVRP